MAKPSKSSTKAYAADDIEHHVCSLPKVNPRELSPSLHPERARLLRRNEKKWANETVQHFYFFDRVSDGPNGSWVGPEAQKRVVREAFQEWKDLEIGLVFDEVADRALRAPRGAAENQVRGPEDEREEARGEKVAGGDRGDHRERGE